MATGGVASELVDAAVGFGIITSSGSEKLRHSVVVQDPTTTLVNTRLSRRCPTRHSAMIDSSGA